MTLTGRIDWIGADPGVVRLTDNGTRRVQITLPSMSLDIRATVGDVDRLISELEQARIWVKEG